MALKLRLHHQSDAAVQLNYGPYLKSGIKIVSQGILLLESEPQTRTVAIHSQLSSTKRLCFPHLFFTLRYFKAETGEWIYPGIFNCGLRICCGTKPFRSLNDSVLFLPIEMDRQGLVCTPHKHDMRLYSSLGEMVHHVLGVWWNLPHWMGHFIPEWESTRRPDCFKNAGSYQYFLKVSYGTYLRIEEMYDTPIPEDTPILDEIFR